MKTNFLSPRENKVKLDSVFLEILSLKKRITNFMNFL